MKMTALGLKYGKGRIMLKTAAVAQRVLERREEYI
jgi:hypothetical protein